MIAASLDVTNTVSAPLLLAIGSGVGAIVKMLIDAWRSKGKQAVEAARLEQVDVPNAQAQTWIEMFRINNDTALRLQADVAKLEKRLDDQDEEHRVELADRDARYAELAELQRETSGSLRRLRSYVVVVTNLLTTNNISFPPMPDEDVAPERRSPTITVNP